MRGSGWNDEYFLEFGVLFCKFNFILVYDNALGGRAWPGKRGRFKSSGSGGSNETEGIGGSRFDWPSVITCSEDKL
ncbi:hypothetical protein KFK09_021963 [Dendrobium nobile]|uniref:Uncharacterized protein n=1 Tax=Dendrobium nobile TaxID=94219 RepID=A0A8T3AHQ8_DENNO|nr:hypothetical protein KFK09_021963 [Dendrobium nobile]